MYLEYPPLMYWLWFSGTYFFAAVPGLEGLLAVQYTISKTLHITSPAYSTGPPKFQRPLIYLQNVRRGHKRNQWSLNEMVRSGRTLNLDLSVSMNHIIKRISRENTLALRH